MHLRNHIELGKGKEMLEKVRYRGLNGLRALRRWAIPYFGSRMHPAEFRPLLCYLFTDWKCNIDCHYCFQYDNVRTGMTLETARSSMDWLKTVGCRVLAIMGGEPLVRKDFILEVIRYGSRNGFFIYLPTNGYLMDRKFIDEAGLAGVTAINLAVDCVAPRKGLPKALLAIEPQFRYLVGQQKKYGFIIFFNINICRTNIKDVRMLTEIARMNGIGTDYHLNEKPQQMINTDHYTHRENGLHVTPEQYPEVDELLDWLIEKQRRGWCMVNSPEHLQAMKDRMRGRIRPWDCRAGHNGALIKPDGSLAPCFDLITYSYDWGRIWEPDFNEEALRAAKEKCLPYCSSTCFFNLGSYYKLRALPTWLIRHAMMG